MIDENNLDILQPVAFDNSIESFNFLTFKPYNNAGLGYSDEIRIPVHNRDLITAPYASYIYIAGTVTRNSTIHVHRMTYNALMHLFTNITLEVNGTPVDKVVNAGMTTTIKSYLSKTMAESKCYESCGFHHATNPYSTTYKLTSAGTFQVYIPARYVMGIFEDYRHPFFNCSLELILSRAADDRNIFIYPGREPATAADDHVTAANPVITLSEVSWKLPVLKLADASRLNLLKIIKDNRSIPVAYRSWELLENPTLQQTTIHTWNIRQSHALIKPRYVIVAFQTNRRNVYSSDVSLFDEINLQSFQLCLNDERHPYELPNLDRTNSQRELLYNLFSRFQPSYYRKPYTETSISATDFFSNNSPMPMIVIDCSKQKEQETNNPGPLNVRLDFTTSSNVPANTTAYCLIIYDRLFTYSSFDGTIKQLL
ncbi:uncharacterized protein LOC135840653 [Planococcus citri]|uniref:uncharacterized protein LOC135840653 n=1 Tax=Planococcus citri TaxID=170843 RepID=UPI0031FA472F